MKINKENVSSLLSPDMFQELYGEVDRIEIGENGEEYYVIVLEDSCIISLPREKYELNEGDQVLIQYHPQFTQVSVLREETEELKKKAVSLQNSLFS